MDTSVLELLTKAVLNLNLPIESVLDIKYKFESEYVGELWQLRAMTSMHYREMGITREMEEEIIRLLNEEEIGGNEIALPIVDPGTQNLN